MHAPPPRAQGTADPPGIGPGVRIAEPPPFDWSPHRGRCVSVMGYAGGGAKTGARLQSGAWTIGVFMKDPPGESAWSNLPSGARVKVQGVVAERADLPVFIQKKGEPVMQGMPVPEGTDLEKARRRYVIEEASVTVVRTAEQAEADLKRDIGKDVSLNGIVWSLNGHWWFSHDGLDIHVEGQDAISGWSDLHGRAVRLNGRLERRALPRIDQITLKPNRDLADAFLLSLRSVTAHPAWDVASCP